MLYHMCPAPPLAKFARQNVQSADRRCVLPQPRLAIEPLSPATPPEVQR